jgi:hypothetical protein
MATTILQKFNMRSAVDKFMVHGKKERKRKRRIIIIIIRNGAKTISLQTLLGRLNKSSIRIKPLTCHKLLINFRENKSSIRIKPLTCHKLLINLII